VRLLRALIILLVVIAVILIGVLAGGSLLSLDWNHRHRAEVATLPLLDANTHQGIVRIAANGYEFRARVAGLDNTGPGVVLLHGFPETSLMWQPLIELLADQGYRVIAFDQRGYSPGARPDDVSAYAVPQLVGDVFAVAEAAGMRQFHLVGHDWGAAVGWAAVMSRPESLLSWTSLSIPHVSAFADALANDADQRKRSQYMLFFRTPLLPEAVFTFNHLAMMNDALYRDMTDAQRAEYRAVFSEPGALTAALNWYRAADGFNVAAAPKVTLPVLFIWGNHDPAVGRYAVESQRNFIAGSFEYHELNAGHWLMEEATDKVDSTVLLFLRAVDQQIAASAQTQPAAVQSEPMPVQPETPAAQPPAPESP
jgi:pimeloyl-ACP methyl ester carboxylesterase